MLIEPIDFEYWRDVNVFTVWQAAFSMCDIEPWDEPISSNAIPPERVEKMRSLLLTNIPHYQTGVLFAQSGWSCKTQRPAQLSGDYFSAQSLVAWAIKSIPAENTPAFLIKN